MDRIADPVLHVPSLPNVHAAIDAFLATTPLAGP